MRKTFLLFILIHFWFEVSSQTFNGTFGPISDDGNANLYTATVSGLTQSNLDSAYGLLKVCLNITHTYDSDLDVQLIAPDGTALTLFSGIGGNGHDFTNTCLQDTASENILNGTAPFSGSFVALDLLGNANNGQNGNGNWTLRIQDLYPGVDTGELLDWSLTFGPHAGVPIAIDSTNLPIVKIQTNGQTIVNEPKITANLQILHKGLGQMNYRTDPANIYNGFIGIEIRGSYSASLPQKPFGFETRTVSGNNLNVSLFSMPAENDWVLISTYNDKTFMRNSLAYHLFRNMGHYAPRSQFCEVEINNLYKGVYLLMEKIKRDSKRVNIAKLDTNENAGDDLTGGYIIKVEYHDDFNSWMSAFSPIDHPVFKVYYVYEYPDAATITSAQKNYIQGFMNSLETSLYGPDFRNPVTGYRAFLDVPSFIDYLIVNELARNNDGFKKSYYFHKDKNSNGGLLKSGPVWDFDWAWKNINECPIFAATNGSGWAYNVNNCNPDNNSPGWMKRLIQDTTFTNELKCRYKFLRSTILDTTAIFHYVDSVQSLMQGAQERHYQKWPILGVSAGTPEIGIQPTTYDGEILKFKAWIRKRIKWLDVNMPGKCLVTGMELPVKTTMFRVFPNPGENELFLESETRISMVRLFNMEGREIIHAAPEKTGFRLRMDNLPSGFYQLVCTLSDGNLVTRRIERK